MDTKILEKIGLTNGESKVYLALLEIGLSSTGQIIEKSQITSSKVYIILQKLEKKGLVSHIIKNNVKYFQSADPDRIIDYLSEKSDELNDNIKSVKEMIPHLKKRVDYLSNTQETTMYQGSKGFQTARDEFIADLSKDDEYCVFGSEGQLSEVYKNNIRKFNIDNENLGIRTRLIYNIKNKSIKSLYFKFKLAYVRFVSFHIPSSIAISKNKVLLMAYGDEPVQVLIKSKTLANSFIAFFEDVWKQSKP